MRTTKMTEAEAIAKYEEMLKACEEYGLEPTDRNYVKMLSEKIKNEDSKISRLRLFQALIEYAVVRETAWLNQMEFYQNLDEFFTAK